VSEYGCNGDYIIGTKTYEEKHTAEDMVNKKIAVPLCGILDSSQLIILYEKSG
jgi:hypothetical protein